MKRIILILVFSIAVVYVNAQVPGFMGRKVSIQASAIMDLAFANIVNARQVDPGPLKGVNVRWAASVDYVTGYKTSIGLNFNYVNTAFTLSESYYDPSKLYKNSNVEAFYFGFNIKRYFGNNLAPVGPYFCFEAGGVYYRSDVYNPSYTDRKYALHSGTFYSTFSFGRKHILFKRMIIDYGFQVGFAGLESLFYSNGGSLGFGDDIDYGEWDRAIKTRLLFHTMFNFYGGIGVVL